jgi:hypothetical protein
MTRIFTVADALNSLGIKEWTLTGNPTNEQEFISSFSKVIDIDTNFHAIFSTNVSDFGVTWNQIQTELNRLQAEYDTQEYQRQRAAEYPDFRDYLDGVVKGDQAQIQAYIDACNAVKAKYPKGQ